MENGRYYLRKLREKANATQKELAHVLGIDQGTYSLYETGKIQRLDLGFLKIIADYFKFPINAIIEKECQYRFGTTTKQP